MGSRDIDIVMTSEEDAIQELHNNFFPKYNYTVKKRGFFPVHWSKTVTTPDGPEEIIVDIFYGTKKWIDDTNMGLEFDWGWALEFQEELQMNGMEIIVPKREILIITKMMAAVARSRLYRQDFHWRLPPKISKDYLDVARLTVGQSLDRSFYEQYVQKSKAGVYVNDFLTGYEDPKHGRILAELGSDSSYMESVLGV